MDLNNRTPHISLDSILPLTRTRGERIERRKRQRRRGTVELMREEEGEPKEWKA